MGATKFVPSYEYSKVLSVQLLVFASLILKYMVTRPLPVLDCVHFSAGMTSSPWVASYPTTGGLFRSWLISEVLSLSPYV